MTQDIAKGIISQRVGEEWNVSVGPENEGAFVFMCKSKDQNHIPSAIAMAVNKKTGKIGSSMFSYDEAISDSL